MEINLRLTIHDAEPKYLVRNVDTKDRQVATGNPKALGRAVTKLIERAAEQEPPAVDEAT